MEAGFSEKVLRLSPREREVLVLMGQGMKPGEVAEHLNVKRSSVQEFASRAVVKFGARHAWHAAVLLLRHELGPEAEYASWGRPG